jgi:hypothetical protein
VRTSIALHPIALHPLALTLPALLFVSRASAAPAELALGELQLELEPRHDFLVEESPDPYARFAGFAQLTGGGEGGGDVAAGAAAAVAGLGCDVLSGRAQGRLRFDATYVGEAHYGICLSRVAVTVVFTGRRGAGLVPALDARRSLWAEHYDDTYDRAEFGFGEIWEGDSGHHTILSMALGHGTIHQGARTVKTLDLDVAVYRYRRVGDHELSVDAIVLTDEAIKARDDDKGGIGTAFYPVRARYDGPHGYLAAAAGWGFSGGKLTASSETKVNGETTSSWTETIDTAGLPQMTIAVGNIEAGVRRKRFQASTRASRAFYPTFDGNVAREARIAGEVAYSPGRTGRTKLVLSPFAARTRTWTRETGTSRDVSAGASLYVGRQLTRELRVDAIGQAGVSPYARLATGLPESTLGGQVLVALSGRVTDLHAKNR